MSITEGSAGSPEAFAELYDRSAPTIFRYLARRIGPVAAEDVTSDTFLVAFERRGSYDPGIGDPLPWLYGIATNLIRKHARAEAASWRGVDALQSAGVVLDHIVDVDARLDAEAAVKRLNTGMQRLSTKDRDVLLLFAWADLSYADIAKAMQIPVGTVRSRLNRARTQLQRASHRGAAPEKEVEHGRVDASAQRAY